MKLLAILACGVAMAALAGVALADGGPGPGVVYGWDGVQAPGGSVRYVALPGVDSTTVAAVRVRNGRVVRFRPLRGDYGVPTVAFDGTTGGVSADGRTLVLASPLVGRSTTRFAVLSTRTLRLRRTVRLAGAFSFDALSPDAGTLYLIEHLRDGERYRVRAYDVAEGRLFARPVSDPAVGRAPMRGYPYARVVSRDGRWAYTLYRDRQIWFIHALDTVRRAAVCVGVPRPRHASVRLVLGRDGRRLAVVRRNGKRVAVVDTRTLRVVSAR